MLPPKEFLQEEYQNVKRSLSEALRYEYGGAGSRQFYQECLFRLELLFDEIQQSAPTELNKIQTLTAELSRLSALITRIERSHLGEFSWPFATALESLAIAACTGTGDDSAYGKPLFFISADGGLTAYRIHPEQLPIAIIGCRIFNIVFPRSLKQHVLLHPILGHEIGHAAWSVPSMYATLRSRVLDVLMRGSAISDAQRTLQWIKTNFGIDSNVQVIQGALARWQEEFLCDLFGLVLMGPSFAAAHRSLLCAIDPAGQSLGLTHPPNVCRYWMLDAAAQALGWPRVLEKSEEPVRAASTAFWCALASQSSNAPSWAKVFKEKQISEAVSALSRILEPLGESLFKHPEGWELSELMSMLYAAVPPVGSSINKNGDLSARCIDFRTILYAGWLAWHSREEMNVGWGFFDLNRLCDHAILQQAAVTAWKNRKTTS